jgi:iron(III) transport system substrate-binding protein
MVACLVALALGAGACGSDEGGGGATQDLTTVAGVLAALEGLDAEAREAKLLELARAEGGTLTWYTVTSEDVYPTIVDAFEEAYGIELVVFRGRSAELVARVTEEAAGEAAAADVVAVGTEHIIGLSEEGLLAPYTSTLVAGLPDGAFGEDWVGFTVSLRAPTWNTELVGTDEIPGSWENLADPRWKGLLALDPSETEWYAALWTYWVEEGGKSEAEADRLFEEIAANAVFVRGHTAQAQLLAAGEFDLGVNATSIIDFMAADGAPVAWEPTVQPAVASISAMGPLAEAPHPAAAVLFVDWALSERGQATFELNEMGIQGLADLGIPYVIFDPVEFAADFDEWSARYEQLAQLGEVREDEEG